MSWYLSNYMVHSSGLSKCTRELMQIKKNSMAFQSFSLSEFKLIYKKVEKIFVPARVSRRTVFPEPEGPMMAMMLPGSA